MGLFDFLKKKKGPDYDPNDVKITDLRPGFIFDYDLSTWVVKEEYHYDWGDEYFTKEFKIDNGEQSAYLHIDAHDDMFITLTNKVRIRAIQEDLPEIIINKEKPPKKLEYKGVTYYREGQNPGYFNSTPDKDSWAELISWDYYDEEGKHTIAIEQWGEQEFEASQGVVLKNFEISGIIPADKE